MVKHTSLIPKIRKAEARLKVAKALLERETGVKEDEGMLLAYLLDKDWLGCWEMEEAPISRSRIHIAIHGLKGKGYVDYANDPRRRYRINRSGKEALKRFKAQLK